MSELRSHRRIGVQAEVSLRTPDGGTLRARSENLSLAGAMLSFATAHGLSVGDIIELSFELPSGDLPPLAVSVNAKVRWASQVLEDTLGVAFEEVLGDEAARCLEALAMDS